MASSLVRWELCDSERKESESGISFSHNPMHFAEAVTFGRNIFLAFPASSAIKNGIAEVAKKKQLSWVMFSTSVQNTFSPKILFCKFTQKENISVEDLLVHVNVRSMSSKEHGTFHIEAAFKIVCSRPRIEQGCCEISIFITYICACFNFQKSQLLWFLLWYFPLPNSCENVGSVEMYSLQEMVKRAT